MKEIFSMNALLVMAFLFYLGSVCGWFIEVIYRRFFSAANPERKWLNPGFCIGPYIPLYGFGLVILYFLTIFQSRYLEINLKGVIIMIIMMTICLNVLEYFAGWMALKFFKVRLWDYRNEWGNINGFICPKFTVIWLAASSAYVFFLHGIVIDNLFWLSKHLAFSFFVGLFFGVFIIDVLYSANLLGQITKYANENRAVTNVEKLKANISNHVEESGGKPSFFFPLKSKDYLRNNLENVVDNVVEAFEEKKEKIEAKVEEKKEKIEERKEKIETRIEEKKEKIEEKIKK